MRQVFIVGSGRCGSSLIHEILARHEKVGFISNVDDRLAILNLKGRWNNIIFRNFAGRFTKKGGLRFAPSEAYRLITRQVTPSYANSFRDLRADDITPWIEKRFKAFIDERQKIQNKEIFIHKYTGWSRLGYFSRLFPDAKFLHVVRDGRAVANSWLQMPWWDGYRGPENWLWGSLDEEARKEWMAGGRSFVALAGIGWNILMDSYRDGRSQLDEDRFHEIRYEDFLSSPREVISEVLNYLNMEWPPDLDKWLAKQPLDSGRKRAFERDLTPQQIVELEGIMGRWLREYRYLN